MTLTDTSVSIAPLTVPLANGDHTVTMVSISLLHLHQLVTILMLCQILAFLLVTAAPGIMQQLATANLALIIAQLAMEV